MVRREVRSSQGQIKSDDELNKIIMLPLCVNTHGKAAVDIFIHLRCTPSSLIGKEGGLTVSYSLSQRA